MGSVAKPTARTLADREELQDFLENAPECLHWVGADGTILWANRAELEFLGYLEHEYVGRKITDFHADDSTISDILGRLTRGESLCNREARLRCKDGSLRDVVINSNVYFRDGKFVHTRCFTRDVTERKRAETELREMNRAKDEFLAMLGHELRNPLGPMLTALHLMRLRLGDEAAKERGILERQVAHLTRLVDDLLDVSRVTRGKIELRPKVVELAWIIAKAVEVSSTLIEERQHRLSIAVPSSGLSVKADEHRLAQVFGNLLTNAAKYTPPGGQIDVEAEIDKDFVLVRVSDNGDGISPQLLPRIFDTFVQGDRSLERSQGGLGLGLSIVQTLVRMHGGTVTARSEGRGKGSTFTVRLALERSASAAPTKRREIPPAPRRCRVLVVDDNRDAAELTADVLRESGHSVEVAFEGMSALTIAPTFEPEVILLDIGLPGIDGYELARRLRAIPAFAKTPLVAITGYGQPADRRRSDEAGFSEHLVKPVDPEKLLALLALLSR